MLKQTAKSVFFFVVLLGLAATAHADSTAEAHRAVLDAYKKGDAAYNRGDAKAVMTLLAPDYQRIDHEGRRYNRSHMDRSLRMLLSDPSRPRVKSTIRRLRMNGHRVVATVEQNLTSNARDTQTRKVVKMESNTVAEETWKKVNRRWLKQRARVLKVSYFINGKPLKF